MNPSDHIRAYWTPIPAEVALAIAESPTGRVPFSDYVSSFPSELWARA